MAISWVYHLKKSELTTLLQQHHLETEGNLTELRQRMARFVKTNPDLFTDKPADPENYDEGADLTRDLIEDKLAINRPAASPLRDEIPGGGPVTPEGDAANLPPFFSTPENREPAPQCTLNNADSRAVIDQIRKWNCHFEGKDVYSFLERVHELRSAYGMTPDHLLRGLPELLKGDALLWYRNYAVSCKSWAAVEEHLRNYFLSPNERRNLSQQIAARRQGPNEPIRTYCTTMLTLMRRRGDMAEEEQTDDIYDNMKPDLRLHIARRNVRNIPDLVQQVEDFEKIRKEMAIADKTTVNTAATVHAAVIAPYNRRECCWRCKQRGHNRTQCRNAPKKFCSVCGKDGVLTRDCHGIPTGNGERTEPTATPTRSGTSETPATSPPSQ